LRRSAFNLLKACSIGLRSGEYGGRYSRAHPRARHHLQEAIGPAVGASLYVPGRCQRVDPAIETPRLCSG
jgi:hypothetical protein